MSREVIIFLLAIGICLIQILWAITDPRSRKVAFTKDRIFSYSIDGIIIILQILSAIYFPWPHTPFDNVIITVGFFMYSFGIGLTIWGRYAMHETWGVPGQLDSDRQKKII